MITITFEGVSKTYGSGATRTRAVDCASWEARGGEVFGLLGPNGSGKTTTIRMILDIIRPDEGAIRIDGETGVNRKASFRARVGYLPEERGLYKKRKVMDVLTFLASLKGLPPAQCRVCAGRLLERFGLSEFRSKKISVLSKGMAQKLQILSCLLHDPDVIILDEPFSGLDPVNVRLIRELVQEMRAAGKLIFLSTHMMAEVEALCDRILLIHRGRQMLYGSLREVKKSHTDFDILLDGETKTDDLACVARVVPTPNGQRIHLAYGRTVTDLMLELGQKGRAVSRLEEGLLPIEDIFVALVAERPGGSQAAQPVRKEAAP